jgi:hypothetical protein
MLQTTNECHFYSREGIPRLEQEDDEKDYTYACTIIFHPDLIKTVLRKHYETPRVSNYRSFEEYRSLYRDVESCTLPDDNWSEKCKRFAPLAFVAHNIRDQGRICGAFKSDFGDLFPNDIGNLRQIHKAWMKVREQFMLSNDEKKVYNSVTDSRHMFLSESSHTDQQQLSMFQRLFKDHRHKSYNVRFFTPKLLNLLQKDTIRKLDSAPRRCCSRKKSPMKVTIYTTRNKEDFIDTAIYENIEFNINVRPDQRTRNPDIQNQEEHLFYVLCRHASAATAYLHHIVNELYN